MATYSEPIVLIGGVPIVEQPFSWALIAGVSPYTSTVRMPKGGLSERLAQIPNPTKIQMIVDGGTSGVSTHRVTFEQIYILEPNPVDDYFVQWSLADARFAWRGKKVFKSWNKTRIRNEIASAPNAAVTDPASLREPFDLFSQGRYVPWSVRENGEPYSVYEMMIQLFQEHGIIYEDDPEGINKSYVEENVEFNGVSLTQAIVTLCQMTRMNIGINPNGSIYAYSLDFFDENPAISAALPQQTGKIGPGTLYRQELSRVRPRKITVAFEKKQEVRLVAVPPDLETINNPNPSRNPITLARLQEAGLDISDFDNRRVLGCINVIQVPYPVFYNGREYNIGEYLTMSEYLLAIGLNDVDVRRYWFNSLLDFEIDRILQGGQKLQLEVLSLAHTIASSIRAHYRQTYMIDPYFRDQMESWDNRRCSVIDNYSKYSPPSPAWADYCLIPKIRPYKQSRRIGLYSKGCVNWIVNEYDPNRESATPGTVRVVNHDLGVFALEFPQLIDQVILEIVPSAIDPVPDVSYEADTVLYQQCSLTPEHTFETMVSVVWATGADGDYNSPDKYVFYEYDYETEFGPSFGPDIHFLSKREYARIPSYSKDTEAEGGSVLDPMNTGFLYAIAQAESAKLIHQYDNRVIGALELAGFQFIRVDGNIKSVYYSFSGPKGAVTTVDMREIPPVPSLEQKLDAWTISYLHRQVKRGENRMDMQ